MPGRAHAISLPTFVPVSKGCSSQRWEFLLWKVVEKLKAETQQQISWWSAVPERVYHLGPTSPRATHSVLIWAAQTPTIADTKRRIRTKREIPVSPIYNLPGIALTPTHRGLKASLMNAVEQELIQIQQELCAAWMNKDRATIERILDPEWSVTKATGEIATKSEVLRDAFELGKLTLNSAQVSDVRVRIFGDTAVVTGRSAVAGSAAGQAFSVILRFTDVFVKRPEGWRAVASHATRIMP